MEEEERQENTEKQELRVVGFSSVYLFPARKREAVTQGRTREIDHPPQKRTQGTDTVKGWKEKRDRGHIPDKFT